MRKLVLSTVAATVIVGIAAVWADSPPAAKPPRENITLLGTLADWKYPDTAMPQGATMSDGGNPTIQSVKLQAVLTTADPFDKVVEFYTKKFEEAPAANAADAKSVTTQDDSEGRPVTVKIFVVNKVDTSTTLVISRAADEKETHIAWSHYVHIDGKR